MAIREVVFKHPVHVGDIVSCYTELVRTGRSSLTVRVRVVAEDPVARDCAEVTTAELVYVHVDEAGRPSPLHAPDPLDHGEPRP